MSSNINDDENSLATANLLASSGEEEPGVPGEVLVEDDGSPGDLQQHAEDDQWLDPKRRQTFFLFMGELNVNGFNKAEIEELAASLGINLKPTKEIMIKELNRRNPDLKINRNNKSWNAIREMFTPLDNTKDIAYVEKKVKELIAHLHLQKAEKDGTINCRQTDKDRIRFAALFERGDIKEAYWKSQDSPTREELDAGETPQSKFEKLLCAIFNDENVIVSVGPYPSLGYPEVLNCEKTEYTMTPEKAKKLLNDIRRNLTVVIERYERSGNGSNQRALDSGTLTLEEGVSIDSLWGRYNPEAARAASDARAAEGGAVGGGDGGLSVTMDGDDRANFLRHEPKDTLIVWEIFDRNDLLRKACAKLGASHMASSESTPATTARGSRSRQTRIRNRNSRDEGGRNRNSPVGMTDSEFDLEFFRAQKLRRLDRNLSEKSAMINKLKSERFELFLRMEDEDVLIKRQMYNARCNELTESITELESELKTLKGGQNNQEGVVADN